MLVGIEFIGRASTSPLRAILCVSVFSFAATAISLFRTISRRRVQLGIWECLPAGCKEELFT